MLHLYASEEELLKVFRRQSGLMLVTYKVGDFRLVVNVEQESKKSAVVVAVDYEKDRNKCMKVFKYASLHEATAGLPDLAGAKSLLKLSDLGITDGHLIFFK